MKQFFVLILVAVSGLSANAASTKIWDKDLMNQNFVCDDGNKLRFAPILINGVRVSSNFEVLLTNLPVSEDHLIASWNNNIIESGNDGSLDFKKSALDFSRRHVSPIMVKIADGRVELKMMTPANIWVTCRN